MERRAEPTKANLIRLRQDLSLAQQGLEILDRKREILMRELSSLVLLYEKKHRELLEKLTPLYRKTEELTAILGPRGAALETIPDKNSLALKLTEDRVMGVRIPKLSIEKMKTAAHPSSEEADSIASDLAAVLPELLSYIETAAAMRRIAKEVSKTQKREKAIEEIHIPGYTKSIAFIASSLDENEREELVRYKTLKKKLSVSNA
jgi:V/A-type H+-transporting ATPase subunit D